MLMTLDDFQGWIYQNEGTLALLEDWSIMRSRSPVHLTREEFQKRLPQFNEVPDQVIDDLLELCRVQFNRFVWGGFLKWGELAFVAHFLTLRAEAMVPSEGEGGEASMVVGSIPSGISSFTAGDVRFTRDTAIDEALMASPFSGTSWGQMFLYLKKNVSVGLVTVT
jgi:hypothetical protein